MYVCVTIMGFYTNFTCQSILLFDLALGTLRRVFDGHTATVAAVSFSIDCQWLASYAPDETPPTLRVWRLSINTI